LMTGALPASEVVEARLALHASTTLSKRLHAGDPSFYVPFRTGAGTATLSLERATGGAQPLEAQVQLVRLAGPDEQALFEAEPNDSAGTANPMIIGQTIEGSADDVEYLDNHQEGKSGLDWFRLTVDEACLVIFELDIPDRDVSVNLRMYTRDPQDSANVVPYLEGKDPMEIVHDREPERYSKAITRVLQPGEYFLEVNANHPRYLLRSYKYPVPPYQDPKLAVEVGLRYAMDVGDAWFAQIPREGNIYRRVQNMHETAMRCTACHPSVFSTEPNLVAHRNGYSIPSKQNFRYVVERIYNSMAPFYGPDQLYWQRFIAIPLQSQGKQGGILADFEKQISGRETSIVERFGPLLRMVWWHRDALPDDEANGVVPADSAFGFAWRDWRMLKEVYRRTGDESYQQAANNLEKIFIAASTTDRVKNLQDRMHIVLGLTYMGRPYHRERIEKEIEALMALQNADGGWHEEGTPGGASAVYTAGQMLYTLMEAGHRPEKNPRIEKGLQWLLAQQQPFGGWFQTTTHENFRTPMRESRYALMALSEGYPNGAPLRGLGNLDGGPATPPAADAPPAQALAKLENILEVEGAEQGSIVQAILPLLQRPEPPVRASAAALLGRIGGEESVQPLLDCFEDPSKLVWREAAWALRQLGNRGIGVDAIKQALRSEDPLERRTAARIFAYQFQGMDRDQEIPKIFMDLAADPELLVRLQALRTLRQWWYRDEDPELRLAIVNRFIERMGVADEPLMRVNLAQNMYILLDENQTGGVSMQRNIRDFPKDRADAVLDGRKWVEEHILLKPVLTALAEGNELQCEALLESFDGSFFKGRFYARVPRNMIDVGNDREFSFMYVPELPLLESTVGAVMKNELRAAQRRRGIQLASFFELPGQSRDLSLKLALLREMDDPDEAVRSAARESVQKDLVLFDVDSVEVLAPLTRAIHGTGSEVRGAVLAALARSPEALEHPTLRQTVLELAERVLSLKETNADLLPFLKLDVLDDRQAAELFPLTWRALQDAPAAQKVPVVEAVFQRPWAVARPESGAMDVLERAATDRDVAVREKLFELLPSQETLRKSADAASLLYAGLSDDSPAIRAKALQLARENDNVWREADTHEYVLKLLVDANAEIRKTALDVVSERRLIEVEPRYAARIKAVMDGDQALHESAEQALRLARLAPGDVTADAKIAEVHLPDILFFRDHVNAYFYQKSADQNACANCHATHTILGLAEPPAAGRALTDDDIVANFRSILKVINVVDPESSLVLRKPRSPFGTGNASAESPTGITHVGGVRWEEGESSEAYQALLRFIRTAQVAAEKPVATLAADSYSPEYPPALAGDGNPATLWHTEFVGATPGFPHELVAALDQPARIHGLTYYPRSDSERGRVKEFEVYVSADGASWTGPVKAGAWDNDALPKTVLFPEQAARFVKLRGLSEVGNQPFMSAAELEVVIAPQKTAG
ncbi:MAG: discoidin domain-containing protein, partial [Candidatus Hydrogenedentes bacterium]|nr:discoidin domain-containing protein [Candidatus Hydrogenedentota bacterium]